jgi:glyoxylase-like metal-dependent hydrolase (beta-lactamase superfamily II)
MRIVRETEHLVRLTRFGMINCFLVREEDGLTLVDTGLRGSSEPILEAARQTGLPIRRIVLTHAHLDHIGALDRLGRALPGVAMAIGGREAKLLGGDFSLEPGETGKRLRGFLHVNTRPTRTLKEGDLVASLRAVASPGHTPGHMSFLDVRDGTLLCGDAFTTQTGLLAAGVFKPFFPFPALFSWNRERSALSARHLRDLKPARLAVGHGRTLENPAAAMKQAVDLAFRQCGKVLDSKDNFGRWSSP